MQTNKLISEIQQVIKKHLFEARQTQFDIFKEDFNSFLPAALKKAKSYIKDFGLDVEIINYDFSEHPRWLAAYKGGSATDLSTIQIGINYKAIFNAMKKRDIHDDLFNIEAQAKITIGHEVAHGIIEYLTETFIECAFDIEDKLSEEERDLLYKYKFIDEYDEEELVEQFGESFFPEATRIRSSEFGNDLKKLAKINDRL